MPDFKKLHEHVRKLHQLLSDQQPGLSTWCMFVGENWKEIAEMWKPQGLAASVPPGSESVHSSFFDKPPLTSRADSEIPERGERLSETLARVFKLWNESRYALKRTNAALQRAMGDLDAANVHVKILEGSMDHAWQLFPAVTKAADAIAACLRSCAQTIRENELDGLSASTYLGSYAAAVEAEARRTSGPPTPDLAAQPDSNQKGQAHELAEHAYRHAMRADLADGPNSNKIRYTVEDDAGTHTVELSRPRIGVHDYASLVSCLRENYKLVFGSDAPLTDPQDMIQRMTAEIQGLRRLGSLDLKGGGVQGDGNDARSSATEDKSDA